MLFNFVELIVDSVNCEPFLVELIINLSVHNGQYLTIALQGISKVWV